MKVLLTGGDGMLATDIRREFAPDHEVVVFPRAELDVTDRAACRARIAEVRPDVVINAAGMTNVDACESSREEAFRVNAEGPGNLAAAAAEAGAFVAHYSTDYVFDGSKSEPYVESDPPNPVSAYGRTKLFGEAAAGEQAWIVRSSGLFGPNGTNFVRTMLDLAREHDEIAVVADQRTAPTYVAHLAAATRELLERPFGVWHLAAEGDATWAEFAEAIFEEAGLETRVRRISSAELGRPAQRPANAVLRSEKGAPALPHWREGLRDCLSRIA